MTDVEQAHIEHSRIGKRPVVIPDGVEVKVEGDKVAVKGPKGSLERNIPSLVKVEIDDRVLSVTPLPGTGGDGKRCQGLARSLINGMVQGAHSGFKISLDLHGVGYRAELKGNQLVMALGLSHQVTYEVPEGVDVDIETIDAGGMKRPRVHLSSHDKELVGRAAARIRSFRPPEPYKGKGVRYLGEQIREKAGKAGGKA